MYIYFIIISALSCLLYQRHAEPLAFLTHFLRPDACLYFADVRFLEKHHAETALTDAAADGEWQLAVEQTLMEVELLAFFLALLLKLAQQSLTVNADAHGRKLEGALKDRIPDEDVAVETRTSVLSHGGLVVIVRGASVMLLAVS